MSSFFTSSYLCFASAAAAIVVAVVGSLRVRRGTADWTFLLGLGLLAADRILAGFSLEAGTLGEVEKWQQWRLLVLSALPGVWLVFSLTFARVNSISFLRQWRVIWPTVLVVPILLAAGFREELFTALHAKDTEPWILQLGWPALALHGLLLPASVLVLTNFERTYRASVGILRWRIKFMLLGVGVVFLTEVYSSSQAILYRSVAASMESISAAAVLVAMLLVARHLFRTTRFDTEVYPSQSVLEGSIIVVLAAVYLLVIGVFAKLVTYFGGDSAFQIKALLLLLALVFGTVLFQSDRVRQKLRETVSRHFQRPVYDYQAIWRKFSEATAASVGQVELCRSVVTLTAEVFQALSVTIWLADEARETLQLVASTTLSEETAQAHSPTEAEVRAVFAYFEANPEPVDIESSLAPWAVALRRWQPSEFPDRGGHRMCAPLFRQGSVGGVMMMGDRVSGVSFPEQDTEMLKCITDHVTTRLMNVQMAQRLVQAKEMEAFQTMAAFFVHDLKNAASTLSLMLRNLPVHFNDPAFMEDALRGISKTAAHINRLIGRLGELRHELKIQAAETDLNEVVIQAVMPLEAASGPRLVRALQPLSPIALDREQFLKVVTNLILNATEATSGQGEVRITTSQANGWVVLTVADQGCGMSAEFLKSSLFRPFQTTKKSGLGIGMFQSKMIVEAHGGRIAVDSVPGKGSTFQVFMPSPPPRPVGSADRR